MYIFTGRPFSVNVEKCSDVFLCYFFFYINVGHEKADFGTNKTGLIVPGLYKARGKNMSYTIPLNSSQFHSVPQLFLELLSIPINSSQVFLRMS